MFVIFVMEERNDRKNDEENSHLASAGGSAVRSTPRSFVKAQFSRKKFGRSIEKRRTTEVLSLARSSWDFDHILRLESVVELEAGDAFASVFAQIGTTGIAK